MSSSSVLTNPAKAANNSDADTDGDDLLEPGEFLPDLNNDRRVAVNRDDEFDNRSSEGVACVGCTFGPSAPGTEFTDISLTNSYDSRSGIGRIYDANTDSFSSGGAFPAPPSNELSNQPGFVFDFSVAAGDIAAGDNMFLNVVFGDYDVTPAEVQVTNGTDLVIPLTVQGGGEDGLIQAATATLDFFDVFTASPGGFDALLNVDFVAPREPYTAFDYVELSRIPLVPAVPEPGTLALIGIGLVGAALSRRRRRVRP